MGTKKNGDPSLEELTFSWGEIRNKPTNEYEICKQVVSMKKKTRVKELESDGGGDTRKGLFDKMTTRKFLKELRE